MQNVTKIYKEKSMTSKDYCKHMVEMINQKKKFYAEQKAKARRSKPMTQAQQRDYMSTFIKNQSSWKLTQLKKLTFDELKTEFEKLVKSIENFVPMETDERVKRQEPVIAKERRNLRREDENAIKDSKPKSIKSLKLKKTEETLKLNNEVIKFRVGLVRNNVYKT
ncbi:hypothetical protein Tco_1548703 [Tanacetum coccineum]